MSKAEAGLVYVAATWLVLFFAHGIIWLGFATGEFSSWPYELPTSLLGGFLLWGWLALFPAASRRSSRIRTVIGVVALPGALVLLASAATEAQLLLRGRPHEVSIAATYLLSPMIYALGYFRLARPRGRCPR